MRKFIFILMLAVSFGLGMVSQTLFAEGNWHWVTPKLGTPAPRVVNQSRVLSNGLAIYFLEEGWEITRCGPTNPKNQISVILRKKQANQ